jgi:hypothetical protein
MPHPVRSTYHAYRVLLGVVTVKSARYEASDCCYLHPAVSSGLLGLHILPTTSFSYPLSLCSLTVTLGSAPIQNTFIQHRF